MLDIFLTTKHLELKKPRDTSPELRRMEARSSIGPGAMDKASRWMDFYDGWMVVANCLCFYIVE